MRRASATTALSLLVASVIGLATANPAAAHHGWEEYDTTAAYYVSGTVSEIRWGNPHPEVTIELETPVSVPADWAELDIPPELEEIEGREVLDATRPYEGEAERLTMDLAPIERLSAWGLDGEVTEGERIEAVGYLGRDDDAHIRPELIVLETGQVVRQRSVPLPAMPEAAPADDAEDGAGAEDRPADGTDGADGSDGADSADSADAAEESAAEDDGSSSAVIWALLAVGVLVVVGGGVYVVRRGNRD
ncbi:hypothetical protein E1265_09360 [Streptomyces sp. 8K308]|uniref:DUF6152 family protein n=1 Tax=Streptomyces sp. 8K308 TaxID=2530388 RepID=UPI001043AC3B|nr:DUF6152 family protein [Streptomyces sp. 8K308]TDC24533.1 hypothetical protein E1265_09360 [Streptomyces sp. 8K308]